MYFICSTKKQETFVCLYQKQKIKKYIIIFYPIYIQNINQNLAVKKIYTIYLDCFKLFN